MAESCQDASPSQESSPSSGEPAMALSAKEDATPPPLNLRQLKINAALVLFLALEAGFVWAARPPLIGRLVAIASIFMPSLALVSLAWGWLGNLFGSEIKEKHRAMLQSPRLTAGLAALVLAWIAPAVWAVPWVLNPPPLLEIFPGKYIYNLVSMAEDVRGSGFEYVLQVRQGGRTLGAVKVTAAGSIFVGRDPKRQIARIDKKSLSEKLEGRGFDRWRDEEARIMLKAPVRRGCVELAILYQTDGRKAELITRQAQNVERLEEQVYLEKKNETCPL